MRRLGRCPLGISALLSLVSVFLWVTKRSVFEITTRFDQTQTKTTTLKPHFKPLEQHNVTLSQLEKQVFFDCNREESLCTFFRPREFFWNGLGKPFVDDYGGTNKNLPAITSLNWRRRGDDKDNEPSTDERYNHIPYNVSFVHMHKCGGSTIKAVFHALKYHLQTLGHEAEVVTYKYSFGASTRSRKDHNSRLRLERIQAIAESHEIVFTVVRDPVERFLSGVQQVMHYHEEFRDACLQQTAQATIQCAITHVQMTDYLRDVHLIPMATHLRLLDETNVSIAVFDLKSLPLLVQYFGATDNTHARDRSNVNVATSTILARMSVDDCTRDMRDAICQLYAVDVAMLQTLGYPTPYC